jgi:hypothetical protein
MGQLHDDLDTALSGFTAGRHGINEAIRISTPYWEATARQLMRRWRAPEGVEVADVVQELLFGMHLALGSFDPERGTSMRRYVVWNACDVAKKWLHVQRLGHRPHRDEDATPSRNARPFSFMNARTAQDSGVREDLPFAVERACMALVEGEPAVLAIVATREAWTKARASSPSMLAPALDALFDSRGDIDAAADQLYASPMNRLNCRLGSQGEAEELVRLSLGYVAAIAGEEIDCTEDARAS